MKVGLVPPSDSWVSLNHVRELTSKALGQHHELHPFPAEYPYASRQRQEELLLNWLRELDVLVGPLKYDIAQARRRLSRIVPWALLILGAMPRGAHGLGANHLHLYTSDVLICNCTADLVMSRRVFPNATSRLVPFAYDDSVFHPADEVTQLTARTEFGLGLNDPIVLYSGRFTIEKNVHSVLKTFRVILEAVPHAKLLLAGDEMHAPFEEFGSNPISTKRLLRRLRTQLGLDGQVLFIGQRTPAQMRALYSTANVLLNLTLHHDENFGMAQVEAMACGLPIVGTAWGGLKDTIVDGVTGAHVPALVTSTGVKVDWWAAANSVVQIIQNGGPTSNMRQRCWQHALEHYSPARYAQCLDQVLRDCAVKIDTIEPLTPSTFAKQFWNICAKNSEAPPPYRRGEAGLRLYRELITPYATAHQPIDIENSEAVWCLPAALEFNSDGVVGVNDPIFPFELRPPQDLAETVRSLAEAFADIPVRSTRELALDDGPTREALVWMHDHGLVLPTRAGSITAEWKRLPVGRISVRMQRVAHETDVVWFS